MSVFEAKQKKEIEFWRDSADEKPEADSIRNIINKVSDAAIFLDCLDRYQSRIKNASSILELGGGQG